MTRTLLVMMLVALLILPSLAQTETRSQCIKRLDQAVLVQTDAEIQAWLDRIAEECPPASPDEQEATETAATGEQDATDTSVADGQESTEPPATTTSTTCYTGDSAYVNGTINVRSGAGTSFDKVDGVQFDAVSVIDSARGEVFCWLQIGENRWIARLSHVLAKKPAATPQTASAAGQEATEPAATSGDPPQQAGSDNYYFEGKGTTTTSPFLMARGKWHWRIRTARAVTGVLIQQGGGSCMTIRGVNTGGAAFASTSGVGAFEVRYPCDVTLEIRVEGSEDSWKVWLNKVENLG